MRWQGTKKRISLIQEDRDFLKNMDERSFRIKSNNSGLETWIK